MLCPILAVESFDNNVYSFSFGLDGFSFRAGQYIMAGPAGMGHLREYSLASSPASAEGRILFRHIPSGLVTPELTKLRTGDCLEILGPFGEFLLPENLGNTKILLAATGTGIAPFSSFVNSCISQSLELDYILLHGVRYSGENYLHGDFDRDRVISCVSRDVPPRGGFSGRISDYLQRYPDFIGNFDMIYICGNCDMIYEVYAYCRNHGFNREQLKAEIYF